jgi:hypothetical protein
MQFFFEHNGTNELHFHAGFKRQEILKILLSSILSYIVEFNSMILYKRASNSL